MRTWLPSLEAVSNCQAWWYWVCNPRPEEAETGSSGTRLGSARCLGRYFPTSLVTWAQALKPTCWKERMNSSSCPLSSILGTVAYKHHPKIVKSIQDRGRMALEARPKADLGSPHAHTHICTHSHLHHTALIQPQTKGHAKTLVHLNFYFFCKAPDAFSKHRYKV